LGKPVEVDERHWKVYISFILGNPLNHEHR
jgi:hypothetical protein